MNLSLRLLSVLLVLALFSCTNSAPEKTEVNTPIESEAYRLSSERLSAREMNCSSNEDCTYIDLHIPKIEGGLMDVRSSINAYIDSLVRESVGARLPEPMGNTSLQQMCESFIEGYELFLMEFPDTEQTWYLEIIGDSSSLGDDYLALRMIYSEFMGGAHGNYWVHYENFDLSTGQPIDIYSRMDSAKLVSAAETAFRKHHGLSEVEDLNEAGFMFEDDRFSLPENISITKEGLLLHYNAYEVASYAQGETSFVIPFEAIQ